MAKDIVINDEVFKNVSKLSFMTDDGSKVTFQEKSELDIFEPSSASLFTFNGGAVTGYTGSETDISIPISYSIKTETKTFNCICKIKDPSSWGSSLYLRFNYINSLTFTDGVITKTYTDYYDMRDGIMGIDFED